MFALDSLDAIASLVESQVRPGESIGIAGQVLRNAHKTQLVKGVTLGDLLLSYFKTSSYWYYRYKAIHDFYQFYCQKKLISDKVLISR